MNPQKPFINCFIPADVSGAGVWRFLFQINTLNCIAQNLNIQNNLIPRVPCDPNYYRGVNMVMYQRQISDAQEILINKFLVPCSKAYSFWTIYNIDDLPHSDFIPKYNTGLKAYLGKKIQDNIKNMINNSDFLLTTTEYLKNAFHRYYDVPLDNILTVPNYMPKWWIGGKYDCEKKVNQFRKHRANNGKSRIGIISSLSHFNVNGTRQAPDGRAVFREGNDPSVYKYTDEDGNDVPREVAENYPLVEDDMTFMIDIIKKTVNDFTWVLFGYCPVELEELAKDRKIEFHTTVPILEYPLKLQSLDLDLVIAPIIDNEFNRCKTNIKFLECCALGIPLLAQDMPVYSNYMDKRWLFKNGEELIEKLTKFKMMSAGVFQSTIEANWKWLNSPHSDGGIKANNWWLEDNLGIWATLFRLPPKTIEISLDKYLKIKESKEKEEMEKQKEPQKIFENNNGVEVSL